MDPLSQFETLRDTLHDFKFVSSQNILYHEHAEKFYGRVIDVTAFLSVVFASSVLASFLDIGLFDSELAQYFSLLPAALLTILNSFVLIWRVSDRHSSHANKRRDWVSILSEISEIELTGDLEEQKHEISKLSQHFHNTQMTEDAMNQRWFIVAYAEAAVRMNLAKEALEIPAVQSSRQAVKILKRAVAKQ